MPIAILKHRRCCICGKAFIAEAGDVLPQKLPDLCPKCEAKQFFGIIGEIAKKFLERKMTYGKLRARFF